MGISIWQLLILLAIVLLLFGTKKLRNIGGDLGGAIKSFKKAMADGEKEPEPEPERERTDAQARLEETEKGQVIEGEATREKDKAQS